MLSPLTFPLVILGMPLALVHAAPGDELAVATGLVPTGTIVEAPSAVTALNAGLWCAAYGALGAWLDRRRASMSSAEACGRPPREPRGAARDRSSFELIENARSVYNRIREPQKAS